MRAVAQAARTGVRCARVTALQAALVPRGARGSAGLVGAGLVGACWASASQDSSVGCFFGSGDSASASPGNASTGRGKRMADDAGPSADSGSPCTGESAQPEQATEEGENALQPEVDLDDPVETGQCTDPIDDLDSTDAVTAKTGRPAQTEQAEGKGEDENEPDRFDAAEMQEACAQALGRELSTFAMRSEATQAALALESDFAGWVGETAAGTSRSLEENEARMRDVANEAIWLGRSDGAAMETAATAARQRTLDVQRADGEMALHNDIACAAEGLRVEHAGHREDRLTQLLTLQEELHEVATAAHNDRTYLARAQAVAILSEALNALSDKIETSSPFVVEIALVKSGLEPLIDWEDVGTLHKLLDLCSAAASDAQGGAAGGVPTAAELASQFDIDMVEIRKAEYLPSNGQASMLDSALATVADRAKIKPAGMTAGDTPLALLARAQHHAHRGELARAVAELEQLRGCQAMAASQWLKSAKARLAIDDAYRSLQQAATRLNASAIE